MTLRFAILLPLAFGLFACGPSDLKLDKTVTVDCSAFAYTTAILELESHTACGYADPEGVLHISSETMAYFKREDFERVDSDWSAKGLRCFSFRLSDGSGGFGYLAFDGRARISNYPYDNNCQPFRNDVAISYVNGKALFFDARLNPVKQTDYVLADPFYKHLAKVCLELPAKKYHGEHFKWVGGKCGYIDTDFNAVVPGEYAYEDARRLKGSKYDGVELAGRDKPILDLAVASLKDSTSPVEAVFRPEGCNLKYCSDDLIEKLDLPPSLNQADTWIKIIRFRLEDQSLWEGQVLSDRKKNLTLHKLFPLEALPEN